MDYQSQKKKVEDILKEKGHVDRNHCIRVLYISRLSAIILDLKKEGWKLKGRYVKENGGKNYYYFLNEKVPQKKVRRTEIIDTPEGRKFRIFDEMVDV